MTDDKQPLDKFEFGGIPPAPRDQPQIEVTSEIDYFQNPCQDKGTGKSRKSLSRATKAGC